MATGCVHSSTVAQSHPPLSLALIECHHHGKLASDVAQIEREAHDLLGLPVGVKTSGTCYPQCYSLKADSLESWTWVSPSLETQIWLWKCAYSRIPGYRHVYLWSSQAF